MWALTGGGDGGGGGRASVVVVVVVVRRKVGWSQCVTWVTFQPWMLDLATHGRLLLINSNYY